MRAALLLVLAGCVTGPTVAPEVGDPLEQLRLDARTLAPLMKTEQGRAFLKAADALTAPSPRTLWLDERTGAVSRVEVAGAHLMTAAEVGAYFYSTRYGSPLAYARAVDLLGQDGVRFEAGQRLVDFGFGTIGPLRLFASLGLDALGVDVGPWLAELYSEPTDQGPFRQGAVHYALGRFPAEPQVVSAVGQGLHVFIAKNTLKKGYVHPDRPPGRPEWVLSLGASDEVFLRAVHDALEPHGRFLIYNICPKPTPEGKPFVTWSDGRSPFSKAAYEAAGFRVKAFDVDDTEFVRELGHRLRWDVGEGAMDLKGDLSVLYTLLERD